MRGLFIDVGEPCGPVAECYGCDYYFNLKDYRQLFDTLDGFAFDKYVIHFDGLYTNILEEMIAKGKNSNKYEVRIHGVDKEEYNLFWNYVNKYWTDQTGWFNAQRK